jgi:hypothetical protein
MRIVKAAVSFEEEILRDYELEHRGWPGYAIGLGYLHATLARSVESGASFCDRYCERNTSITQPSHRSDSEVGVILIRCC